MSDEINEVNVSYKLVKVGFIKKAKDDPRQHILDQLSVGGGHSNVCKQLVSFTEYMRMNKHQMHIYCHWVNNEW